MEIVLRMRLRVRLRARLIDLLHNTQMKGCKLSQNRWRDLRRGLRRFQAGCRGRAACERGSNIAQGINARRTASKT